MDITISHAAQRSEQPYNCEKARAFLRKKEKEKHTKYDSPGRAWAARYLGENRERRARKGPQVNEREDVRPSERR